MDDFKVTYQMHKNITGAFCLEKGRMEPVSKESQNECVDLKLTTMKYASEIHWSFGSCCSKQKYENNKEYTIKCCQPPGDYELACMDSAQDGWHGAYIQVGSNEAKLCEDYLTKDWRKKDAPHKTQVVNHPTGDVRNDAVCVNLRLTTKEFAKEISWTFGSCSSSGQYEDYQVYDINCCQAPGEHALTCSDTYADGWHGGYIQVGFGGAKICKDFTSDSQTQTVKVAP